MEKTSCCREVTDRLRQLKSAYERISQLIVAGEGDEALSFEQLQLLWMIKNLGPSQKELADCLCVTQATLSVRVKKLVERGYILQIACEDKRMRRLQLTEAGECVMESSGEVVRKLREQTTRGITVDDYLSFIRVLDTILVNTADIEKEYSKK